MLPSVSKSATRLTIPLLRARQLPAAPRALFTTTSQSASTQEQQGPSTSTPGPSDSKDPTKAQEATTQSTTQKTKKTQAQLDQELQLKMAGLAGDGGEAGLELEDGQPVSMKRGVKNNMFRYI